MQLPEIEREAILAQRLEELQRVQDKRNLDQIIRAQRGDTDGVAKAAKRESRELLLATIIWISCRHAYGARRNEGKVSQARRIKGETKS